MRIENCNSAVNNVMANYIADAVAAGGNAVRRIRMTGVAWSLPDIDTLYEIATKWKGFNALGGEQEKPVITGTVSVYAWSSAQLTVAQNTFGEELVITADPAGEAPMRTVTFENYDGTTLYTTSVRNGRPVTDPVNSGLISVPTKPSTVGETFDYAGWDGSLISIIADTTLTATYTASVRKYTVRWWDGAVCVQTDIVDAYDSCTYNGEWPTGIGGQLFIGWDADASSVESDMDINAVFVTATMPSGTS